MLFNLKLTRPLLLHLFHLKYPSPSGRSSVFLTGERGRGALPKYLNRAIQQDKREKNIEEERKINKMADFVRGRGTLSPVIPWIRHCHSSIFKQHDKDFARRRHPKSRSVISDALAELTRQTFTSRNSLKITPRPTSDDECVSVHSFLS